MVEKVVGSRSITSGRGANMRVKILVRNSDGRERNGKGLVLRAVAGMIFSGSDGYAEE